MTELGRHNFVVEPHRRVKFKQGDLIGVYFPSQNPIPFTKGQTNCSHPTLYAHNIKTLNIGKIYAFRGKESGWNPCRIYSLYAEIVNTSKSFSLLRLESFNYILLFKIFPECMDME